MKKSAVVFSLSFLLMIVVVSQTSAQNNLSIYPTNPVTANPPAQDNPSGLNSQGDHPVGQLLTINPSESAPGPIGAAQKFDTEGHEYTVGVDDILEVVVLKPDPIQSTVTVSLDGFISFPYIGGVRVKDRTLSQIQNDIQNRLADGYMKYPVVSVLLKESRSRKFFVYGEVNKPGTYALEENTTVLRAISVAGGFTKYGSSSRVKVLRPRKGEPGYVPVKVDIATVMAGNSHEDIVLQTGDIVVVSEGVF